MDYSEQIKKCMQPTRDFTRVDYSKKENILPIRKAAKMKCMDCTCGERNEARECTVTSCAIWPYRGGINPKGKKIREFTDEQRQAVAARFANARASRSKK
jgi:hypothetical protein